jgi:putative intracellular protease/amidase
MENYSFQVAILLYPGVTALDAVGPWEVLSRMCNTEIRFVGREVGPVMAEGGGLLLGVSHTTAETPSPDLVIVPGGVTTPGQMVDDDILGWVREVHNTTTWTASVCTGSLILGAAGILKGVPATSHWYKLGVLRIMGAKPHADERIVRSGKLLRLLVFLLASIWRFGLLVRLLVASRQKRSS